jgi:pimeloyl-ACP methyl ester carboxylesterase
LVTKEELLDGIWGDRFVSESALTSRLKAARRAIGDDGQTQRCIRTVHGRGYRFVAPVLEIDSSDSDSVAVGTDAPDVGLEESEAIARDAAAPIRYTQRDDLNIAYQVTGSGSPDLVLVAGFVSHLMLDWTERRHAHFLHRLGSFSRLIRFDKRGTGMSDRPGDLPDLETRMGDLVAVMDAARSERAVLFGYSEGGPMSILYAATHPERVDALVIYSSYARRLWAPDYPWAARPEERARYAEQLEADWAWEADMRHMCPNADEELARWWGERCWGPCRRPRWCCTVATTSIHGSRRADTWPSAYRAQRSSNSTARITSSPSTRIRSSTRSRSSSAASARRRRASPRS